MADHFHRVNSHKLSNNQIGCDGKRMLCITCKSDKYFSRACKSGSLKDYARRQLSYGTSAVHFLHDFSEKMYSIKLNTSEEGLDVDHVNPEEELN